MQGRRWLLNAALLASARAALAQGVPEVGLLMTATAEGGAPFLAAFREGLAEQGLRDGETIRLGVAQAQSAAQFETAAVALPARPAVVVGGSFAEVRWLMDRYPATPVVMVAVGDPVGFRLIESLERPGGRVTGLSDFRADFAAARLLLARAFVPGLRRVGFLHNPDAPSTRFGFEAGRSLGIEIVPLVARTPAEMASVIGGIAATAMDALVVVPNPLTFNYRRIAAAHRLNRPGFAEGCLTRCARTRGRGHVPGPLGALDARSSRHHQAAPRGGHQAALPGRGLDQHHQPGRPDGADGVRPHSRCIPIGRCLASTACCPISARSCHRFRCNHRHGPIPCPCPRLRDSTRPMNLCRHASRLVGLALASVLASPAIGQSFGSPAVGNFGPPSDALFPALAEYEDRLEQAGWLLRGQSTFVLQGQAGFRSPYRSDASLRPAAQARNTTSVDLVLGRRLWDGAEAIVDVSITRGFGLSNSVGVAAFPNNEAFRLGTTEPYVYTPRAFIRQTIGLSADTIPYDGDPLRFNEVLPRQRITITAGKFGVWDIFDDNKYAHDPRAQFLNWALVGGGAFDYAADARGWTEGIAVEYDDGIWGVRTGVFRVPRRANGLFLDTAVTRGWQALGEVDRFYEVGERPGAVRLIYGASRARQSSWGEIFQNGFDSYYQNPSGYRLKHHATLNIEQEIMSDLGAFARLSWSDGRVQNFMFTQMDRAASVGLSLRGAGWGRLADTVGLAANVGWLSTGQRRYLEDGGIGFIVGDGRLNYRPEFVTETYYDTRVAPGVNAALNYQLVVNPGYNRDRGPVHVVALRLRVAF